MTDLQVIRKADGSLWQLNWTMISGRFSNEPRLVFDPILNKWVLTGLGMDGITWYQSTFEPGWIFNNDWTKISPPIIPPVPPPQPSPQGNPFPWGDRINQGISKGQELVFVADVVPSILTTLHITIIGQTNETDVEGTWAFPDGKSFDFNAFGTSVHGAVYLRSSKNSSPNLWMYDYIPDGKHVFRIFGKENSSLVIRGVVY